METTTEEVSALHRSPLILRGVSEENKMKMLHLSDVKRGHMYSFVWLTANSACPLPLRSRQSCNKEVQGGKKYVFTVKQVPWI